MHTLLLLLIIFLPILNFCFLYFNMQKNFIFFHIKIVISSILFIFISSIYLFISYLIFGIIYQINFGIWFNLGLLKLNWGFLFDQLTISMLLIITAISFFVHFFSLEYLKTDKNIKIFFAYISLFTFFMLILVTADNFVQLFLGWEGVGLCSFLLISFWNTRIQAFKSALKAMIMNRIGDFFLLGSISFIFFYYRTLKFSLLSILLNSTNNFNIYAEFSYFDLITLCICLAAIGKSAQIGLHTWLPDAMEGPTPVSALIHAATMVTAGIFLLIRCSTIIEYSNNTLMFIIFSGAITAFISATISLFQNDIKKIIAYSTCSQLGYMFLACGFSIYNFALYHLITHAFFKALLFLCAGSIIHAILDEQDIRKMGGLAKLLPLTYICVIIGSLALLGFPFFSGYYSKDAILENILISTNPFNNIIYFFLILTAFFTTIYSMQIIILTFFSFSGINRIKYQYIQENNWIIGIILFLLSLCSIFVGYLFFEIYCGLSSPFLDNSIYIHKNFFFQNQMEFDLLNCYKLFPIINGFLGIFFCIIIYKKYFLMIIRLKFKLYFIYLFFIKKWYFDIFFNYITFIFFKHSYSSIYMILDKGFLEFIGPSGIIKFLFILYHKFFIKQKNSIYQNYIYIQIILLSLYFLSIIFFY
jgi:proton-translocating NADH-quinone oxidoreductase chain L